MDIEGLDVNPRLLLDLDRHLLTPYYMRRGKKGSMILFDEKTYAWFGLCDFNIRKILNGYKNS